MSIFQYTTLANARVMVGLQPTDTSYDALLKLLLVRCSLQIESYCRRVFGPQTYTNEIYSGTGTPMLSLRQRPILSVASVYLDPLAYFGDASGAFGSQNLLTEGADNGFAVEWDAGPGSQSTSGLLLMISDIWPQPVGWTFGRLSPAFGPPSGNIQVTYTAGYLGTPQSTSSATTTSGSPTVTGIDSTVGAVLVVGMVVSGTGIPSGTIITALLSSTSVTLSANATANGTATLTFSVPCPADVMMACELLIAYVKNTGKWGAPVNSASYDGASISFDLGLRLGLMTDSVTALLAPYVNQAVA